MAGGSVEVVDFVYEVDNGRRILGPISLSIREGERVCVIGPSGTGKTTLLRAIAGLVRPSQGQVLLGGQEVKGPGRDAVLMFQRYNVFPWLSVSENIAFGLGRRNGDEDRKWVRGIVGALGLAGLENRMPRKLSGGQQQRVALGRAMAARPKVLLMDEPFGALDALTRRSVQRAVRRVSQKFDVTVVFVTHDLDEAAYLGDRVIVLRGEPGLVVKDVQVSTDPGGGGAGRDSDKGRRLGDRLERAMSAHR